MQLQVNGKKNEVKVDKKFEKEISEIKNKDIRNSLSQLWNIVKND